MKVFCLALAAALAACFVVPLGAQAAGNKTFTGTVVGISGSGITFTNSTAATYSAELGCAVLLRKNGTPMLFGDIRTGDKVQVIGQLWGDYSISASSLEDLSFYTHSGSFTGKISYINLTNSSLTLASKAYGSQTISTNNQTAFSINGSNTNFAGFQLGMSVTVKGTWDRTNTNVLASSIQGTLRYIAIDFTGMLSFVGAAAFTVVGNGSVIYGVDASKADWRDKGNNPLPLNGFRIGDSLHVWGQHASGTTAVVATKIKDLSVSAGE